MEGALDGVGGSKISMCGLVPHLRKDEGLKRNDD